MKKDVIYIDVDDDITSIIGKVKGASEHVVALVPPKRVGVLQSAVNLKLLKRTAETNEKRLVLISADPALIALAAMASIPVARNLQTKPELVKPESMDKPSDDVIDGKDLTVGELAKVSAKDEPAKTKPTKEDAEVSAALRKLADDSDKKPLDNDSGGKKKKDKNKKVPNYSKFRKRLLIFGGIGVVLIAFLVWAIFFAPKATVTVTAKTSSVNIDETIKLDPSADTNVKSNIIQPVVKQVKKTNTADITATGKKTIGDKASGTIKINNCTDNDVTLSSGTVLTSGGLRYALNQDVSIESGSGSLARGCTNPGSSSTVGVTATAIGPDYNDVSAGAYLTVAGYSCDTNSRTYLCAVAQANFSGGKKEDVKVLQQSDVDKVASGLKSQDDPNNIKSDLKNQLGDDVIPIDSSFSTSYGKVTSNPSVGTQTEKGTASMDITYTMYGVKKSDLNAELDQLAKSDMDDAKSQKIYSNGLDSASLADFASTGGGAATVDVKATAEIGPKLDEQQILDDAAGKKKMEIEETLTNIPGVQSVNVDLWPFWVNTAPSDTSKITVKFSIDGTSD